MEQIVEFVLVVQILDLCRRSWPEIPKVHVVEHVAEFGCHRWLHRWWTCDEAEVLLHSHRAKLYRQRNREWEKTGTGDTKLLQHTRHCQVRSRMRHEKTMKIVGECGVSVDYASHKGLKPFDGSHKGWKWLALKFVSNELAMNFKDVLEFAQELRIPRSAWEY